jgi:hypothetical protein
MLHAHVIGILLCLHKCIIVNDNSVRLSVKFGIGSRLGIAKKNSIK